MKPLCKMVAFALLTAALSPSFSQAYAANNIQRQPAGCHEHGRKVPATPLTYQCCQTGHQVAALRESLDLRARFLQSPSVIEFVVLPCVTSPRQFHSELWSPALGPPDATSLRI
jgi:hypothetical protein